MKLFQCQNCGEQLYFENTTCEKCGHALGYVSDQNVLSALVQDGDAWQPLADPNHRYHYCRNQANSVCNWLVPTDQTETLCVACELNRMIPNLQTPGYLQYWQELEIAKHRLVYSLQRLGLPVVSKTKEPQTGLAFDFLADEPTFRDNAKVITGHAQGIITINIAEADPVKREQFRAQMAEPYRTLLGHFRHEIGHYYWERIVRPHPNRLTEFRRQFGDESTDYGAALEAYYAVGPPQNWNDRFVSAYAASHPFEDWAETWAHYIHIVDTLETANAFGLRVKHGADPDDSPETADPYQESDFQAIIDAWFPLTIAVNSLNRSMGQSDLYPFVLSPYAIAKMQFIHQLIKQYRFLFGSTGTLFQSQ